MPENLRLSQEMVQQIVRETQAKRELSQREIKTLASMLNLILSEYERREELRSEPTFQKLRAQTNALRNALRKAVKELKPALPSPEQSSLRNYLIHLGEKYAAEKGQHSRLAPHRVSGLRPDKGEEITAEDHYRSDERLDQIIDGVTKLLDWIECTPARMKRPSNWWDRIPHWLEDQSEAMERLGKPRHLRTDAHRRRSTEYLIGNRLPQVYEMTFQTKYGVSRPPGPGIRFVSAVLRHAAISNDDNKSFSSETVIKYRQNCLRAYNVTAVIIAAIDSP